MVSLDDSICPMSVSSHHEERYRGWDIGGVKVAAQLHSSPCCHNAHPDETPTSQDFDRIREAQVQLTERESVHSVVCRKGGRTSSAMDTEESKPQMALRKKAHRNTTDTIHTQLSRNPKHSQRLASKVCPTVQGSTATREADPVKKEKIKTSILHKGTRLHQRGNSWASVQQKREKKPRGTKEE